MNEEQQHLQETHLSCPRSSGPRTEGMTSTGHKTIRQALPRENVVVKYQPHVSWTDSTGQDGQLARPVSPNKEKSYVDL